MKSKYLNRINFIFFCGLLLFFSCPSSQEKQVTETKPIPPASPENCIERIITQDDSLGNIRNYACQNISLARTIRNYTDALNQLDYSDCSPEFIKAIQLHRFAWLQMIPLMEKYPEMRGEMHELFDQIKLTQDSVVFNTLLKDIWDTWVLVENESMKQ